MQREEPVSQTESVRYRPIRTLLVDDAPRMIEALSEFLNQLGGIDIIGVAHDGTAAVRAADESAPDLVIMDINMPHMNGIKASRRIKGLPHAPKVILMSLDAHGIECLPRAAEAARADGWCDKQELAARIASLIHSLFPTVFRPTLPTD